jgi:hypothetical protein
MRTTEADNDTRQDRDRAELSALCTAVLDAKTALQEREGELLGHILAMVTRCRCRTIRQRATHARELKSAVRIARNFLTSY